MTENILQKFFEHNLWANLQILQACAGLTAEQLDAEPQSATKGTIRTTLTHLVEAEQGYLADLIGEKSRFQLENFTSFSELETALHYSGEGFLVLARDASDAHLSTPVHTEGGYTIQPWVLLVQAVNHASEHREQIKSMLSSLGVKPPRIDGWVYARTQNAFIAPAK